MSTFSPTRRRLITISAAAALDAVTPVSATAGSPALYEWQGAALGAKAHLTLLGFERSRARALVRDCLAEVERLERCFSLYRRDSELTRLNARGYLRNPSQDFRRLLETALYYWGASAGAFNPAVQPLWQLVSQHFARHPDGDDPDTAALAAARDLADPTLITRRGGSVRLAPGMALTFNGIAQGYITDRVCERLEAAGCRNVLVALGEWRALPGRRWPVRVPDLGRTLDLARAALAVSAPGGTPLSADGRWNHLFDPRNGRSVEDVKCVAVRAREATAADALSTALAVATKEERRRIAARFADAVIFLQPTGGIQDAS